VAIQRIWRQHGLLRPRRRKYQRKQDLAALKETWALFQQISAHTKDLDDIPHYWPQMKARGLPLIQYTAREVRSGLQFLAYAERRSAGASAAFAHRIQSHLQRCGVNLRDLTWQTDNGTEFVGELQPDGSRSGFPAAVTYFGSQHDRIPPAAHTYQSEVETVHRLIEDEFFDLRLSTTAPTSWPRPPSISSISTSSVPTPTRKVSVHGKSSTNSIPTFPSASPCFLRSFSITVSTNRGDTMYPVIPTRPELWNWKGTACDTLLLHHPSPAYTSGRFSNIHFGRTDGSDFSS
jgi:hypothetical protein